MKTTTDYLALFKNLGLKATPKRLALLSVLEEEHRYLSPEEVWKKIKRRFKSLGLPTVYRNMEELERHGVISKVLHSNRQLYYYFCPKAGHHHHFVCMECRMVEDLSVCTVREMEKEIKGRIKGTITSHILQVNGFCGSCAGKQ